VILAPADPPAVAQLNRLSKHILRHRGGGGQIVCGWIKTTGWAMKFRQYGRASDLAGDSLFPAAIIFMAGPVYWKSGSQGQVILCLGRKRRGQRIKFNGSTFTTTPFSTTVAKISDDRLWHARFHPVAVCHGSANGIYLGPIASTPRCAP